MTTPPFSALFVPCTAPESACEVSPQFFLGAAGTCNNVTNLCECPSGFSGADVVLTYNDCHVNETFKTAGFVIGMIVSAVAIFVTCLGIVKLSVMWGVLFWHQGDEGHDANLNGTYRAGGREERSELRTRDVSLASKTPKPLPNLSVGAPQPSISSSNQTSTTAPSPIKTLQHYTSLASNHPSLPSPKRTSSTADQPSSKAAPANGGGGSPVRAGSKGGVPSSFSAAQHSPRGTNAGGRSIALEDRPSQLIRRDSSDDGDHNHSGDEEGETRTNMSRSHGMKRKKSRAPRLSIKPMQHPKTNVRSASFVTDITMAKRRRNTFLLMSCFTAYSCYSFITLVMFDQSFTIETRNAVLLWAFWSAFACLQLALWIMAYSWCATLPAMKAYAKMFPMFASHPLMRFPGLPRIITGICNTLSLVFSGVFFFILPLNATPQDLYDWIIPVGLTLTGLLLLVLLIFQSVVFSLLLKMFDSYNQSQRAGGGGSTMDQHHHHSPKSPKPRSPTMESATNGGRSFNKPRRTIWMLLVMGWSIGPMVVVFLLLAAWEADSRRNIYVYVNGLFILGGFTAIGSTYVSVYRLSLTNRPDRVRNPGTIALRSHNHNNMPESAAAGVRASDHHAAGHNNTSKNSQPVRVSDGRSSMDDSTLATPKPPRSKSQSNRNVNQTLRISEVPSKDSTDVQLG